MIAVRAAAAAPVAFGWLLAAVLFVGVFLIVLAVAGAGDGGTVLDEGRELAREWRDGWRDLWRRVRG